MYAWPSKNSIRSPLPQHNVLRAHKAHKKHIITQEQTRKEHTNNKQTHKSQLATKLHTQGHKTTACGQYVPYNAGTPLRGTFCCPVSGVPLFTTDELTADTATSGWLSFREPIDSSHIELREDTHHAPSVGHRTEALCAASGCHLGHYFGCNEGYCINACALTFHPSDQPLPVRSRPVAARPSAHGVSNPLHESLALVDGRLKTMVLAAGCFWGVDKAMMALPGVVHTRCGYAGGRDGACASYAEVCAGGTRHAEAVKVQRPFQVVCILPLLSRRNRLRLCSVCAAYFVLVSAMDSYQSHAAWVWGCLVRIA
jgi:peptide methionine sulfoxide reductase MsrB